MPCSRRSACASGRVRSSRSRTRSGRHCPSRGRATGTGSVRGVRVSRWSPCCRTSWTRGTGSGGARWRARRDWRQDGHDQRFSRRLVRRLLILGVAGVWVGFDQPETIRDGASGARHRAADLGGLHAAHGAAAAGRRGAFTPPGACIRHEMCRISYQRPVAGCPTYVEYLKEGDEVPDRSARCTKAP